MRFLQFAGSKATEYELMECCIIAHLKHVHQWRFLRIHGISSYHSQTGSSLRFAQITSDFLSQHLWGADFLSASGFHDFQDASTRFMLLCSFFSRLGKSAKKNFLGVPLSNGTERAKKFLVFGKKENLFEKTTWKYFKVYKHDAADVTALDSHENRCEQEGNLFCFSKFSLRMVWKFPFSRLKCLCFLCNMFSVHVRSL